MKKLNFGNKTIIILILVQTFLVLFVSVVILGRKYFMTNPDRYDSVFNSAGSINIFNFITPLLILAGIIGILSFFIIIEVLNLKDKETRFESAKLQLEEMRNFNLTLREQRHDILNHCQVILGYIQLEKNEYAEDYIKQMINLRNVNLKEIENYNLPENIKILLHNKITQAEERNIDFKLDINAAIEDYNINTFDLTRIISNLLSNAFYAVETEENEEKKIEFSIREDNKLIIEVANTGKPIPLEIKPYIFNPEVTTKGENGDGMGLYIVKKLTRKNNGKIDLVQSNVEKTKIRLRFDC